MESDLDTSESESDALPLVQRGRALGGPLFDGCLYLAPVC